MTNTVRVTFSKKGLMAFISHLDLMRLFQRAGRRAGMPFEFTKGFNPHPKISVVKALKLGVESDSLEAVFCLERGMDADEFRERLNKELPEGVRIKDAKRDLY